MSHACGGCNRRRGRGAAREAAGRCQCEGTIAAVKQQLIGVARVAYQRVHVSIAIYIGECDRFGRTTTNRASLCLYKDTSIAIEQQLIVTTIDGAATRVAYQNIYISVTIHISKCNRISSCGTTREAVCLHWCEDAIAAVDHQLINSRVGAYQSIHISIAVDITKCDRKRRYSAARKAARLCLSEVAIAIVDD